MNSRIGPGRLRLALAQVCLRLGKRLRGDTGPGAGLEGLGEWALHAADSVVLTDAQRRITWVNDGFARLTGYRAEDAIGRTPGSLLQCEGTDPATVAHLRQALDAGRPVTVEILNRSRSGQVYWVELKIQPVLDAMGRLDGFMSLQIDITARRALKAELKRSAELLRNAIEVIDEAFVLYDPQDRLVFCNEKYKSVYALSADLLVPGAKFEDIIREGARRGQYPAALGWEEEWVRLRVNARRDENRILVQRLAGDRVVRIVERRMPDGHHVGFRVDITDLVRATEAAERTDRAKSEFIATISHELRTPLQAILGFSDLGRHFAADHPQFGPMFKDIHAGGQRMLRLVNGLLDVSKIDGSQGSLTLKRGDLLQLALEVTEELASLAAERGLRFVLPEPPTALPADMDAFRIQQVLRNLMANALRFAPPGSVIEVQGRDLGIEGVQLSVRDHGPGIPDDELEAVFEAFVQSSRTRNGAGGTGLGLTISRKIVNAHGGRIEAMNAPDGGACLRVWLPRAAACATDPIDAAAAAATAAQEAPPILPATRTLRQARAALLERESHHPA